MSTQPPIVLTFAASDPTGGAGLQADLLTLASSPLYGAGHARRRNWMAIDSTGSRAGAQLSRTCPSRRSNSAYRSIDNIATIAAILSDYPKSVILDPVFASGAATNSPRWT